jgi:hypothetical protein
VASAGITFRQYSHFLVVGSSVPFDFWAISVTLFIGCTTKKNITAATIRNEIKLFRKSPYKNGWPLKVK